MIKETPSLGRILAMVVFALSCIGLLMFLWLSFGGPVPLRPEGYRFKVHIPEAATLAQEADVRLAGVNVGKVKTKELDKGGVRTIIEVELKERYSPIPKDSRVMLRQKTLLGETYVQISQGHRSAGMLADGGTLPNARVESTVELDEIFSAFDEPTRRAFQQWQAELTKAIAGGRGQDLNDAFGNLEGFAVDGAELLRVLDEQGTAVRRLIRNTGQVFGAINQRQGALRELVVNSNNTFEATASRDDALAETFRIFPTFLDESKATMARLETFSRDTRPLVNDLKGPADDLGPTVRDLGDLAPDLERLFRDLNPLIRASRRGVPDLERVIRGLEPMLEGAHVFFSELNPILSYFNFAQATIADFITIGGSNIAGDFGGQRYQTQIGVIDAESFERHETRPPDERGNAYLQPNALGRAGLLGAIESFDCSNTGQGEIRDPIDSGDDPAPPCLVQPPSLFSGKHFTKLERGVAPQRDAPQGNAGTKPADPNR